MHADNNNPKIIVLDDETYDALIQKGWLIDEDRNAGAKE